MTIRTKIIVFQVFFVGLLLMMAGVVYFAVQRTDRFTERVQHAHRQLVTITALSLHANQYSEQIAEMLLFGEEGRPDLEEARRQVERSFQALEQIIRSEGNRLSGVQREQELEELRLVAQMRAIDTRMHETALELLELQMQGRGDEARRRYRTEIEDDLDNRLQELVDLAIADERGEVDRIESETDALAREMTLIVASALLLGLLVGIGAAVLLSRALSLPITRLAEGAAAIGGGRLDHRIAVEGRDELALLSDHFNRMVEQLQRQRRELLEQQALLSQKVGERTAELADANHRLEDANRRLKDLDRLRMLFLADVSHELRTPLTVLRGEAEVTLRNQANSPEDYRETLARIVEQAQGMSRLVDDLLFLTRTEADSIRFQMRPVVLQELLAEAVDEAEVLARAHGRRLQPSFADEPLVVQADGQRLKQTMLIAIDNALKYSHVGTDVTVALHAAGEDAVAAIRNQGDPVPPEDLPYIFDRFYRGRQDQLKTGGSGLGLSIAKWIVEKHGGQIGLSSGPDGITELEIRLPLAR
ncbi:sensor histidine kinase [Geminicoccus flavidas]|uniref:sensor histidine kinase n=1 Tax=Geminicoccus flavidas TaxID=2506407 RepID=UPI0013582C9C|nr:ATP-binding protein [Geminicoccus flavidas]